MANSRTGGRAETAPTITASVLRFPPVMAGAGRPPAGTRLTTRYGDVLLDLAEPGSPVARASFEEGQFVVDGTALGVEIPFAYSETSCAFVFGFAAGPVVWCGGGRLADIERAYAAVGAVRDAVAYLVDRNPRILAVARVETMSRRLVALDADIAASSDRSKAAMRAELSVRLVAARRALLSEVRSLSGLPDAA